MNVAGFFPQLDSGAQCDFILSQFSIELAQAMEMSLCRPTTTTSTVVDLVATPARSKAQQKRLGKLAKSYSVRQQSNLRMLLCRYYFACRWELEP